MVTIYLPKRKLYSDKEYKWYCVFSCGIMTNTFPFLSQTDKAGTWYPESWSATLCDIVLTQKQRAICHWSMTPWQTSRHSNWARQAVMQYSDLQIWPNADVLRSQIKDFLVIITRCGQFQLLAQIGDNCLEKTFKMKQIYSGLAFLWFLSEDFRSMDSKGLLNKILLICIW